MVRREGNNMASQATEKLSRVSRHGHVAPEASSGQPCETPPDLRKGTASKFAEKREIRIRATASAVPQSPQFDQAPQGTKTPPTSLPRRPYLYKKKRKGGPPQVSHR